MEREYMLYGGGLLRRYFYDCRFRLFDVGGDMLVVIVGKCHGTNERCEAYCLERYFSFIELYTGGKAVLLGGEGVEGEGGGKQ